MKSIILIASCFYLIISVIGRESQNLSEQDQVYNGRLMPRENKQVSGYLCGDQLFRSKQIEDTKIQACRNLKSLNFLHRYPMKYRPRKGSQQAIQRTPDQDYYIFPLRESSKMKRLRKPFRHMEAKSFIVINQRCGLKNVLRVKKKPVKHCRLKICFTSVIEVEKQCENRVWSVKDD